MKKTMKRGLSILLVVLVFASMASLFSTSAAYAPKFSTAGFTKTGKGATDMVNLAKTQVGKSGSTYGYSSWWCAAFISDLAQYSGQRNAIPVLQNCSPMIAHLLDRYGAKLVATVSRSNSAPTSVQPGDLIFYSFDNFKKDTSMTYNGYNVRYLCDHVGLVTEVSGGKIYTIQGGLGSTYSSAQVKRIEYKEYRGESSNYSWVAKFVRPNYANSGSSVSPTNPSVKLPGSAQTMTSGRYNIINYSGKYLNAFANPGKAKANTNICVSNNDGTKEQQFSIVPVPGMSKCYYIQSLSNGNEFCVNAESGSVVNPGANVHLWNKNTIQSKMWKFIRTGNYYIICNVMNPNVVLAAASSAHRANVRVETYNANNNLQKWTLVKK